MYRRLLFLAPVLVFTVVAVYFLWGLDPNRDPRAVPSVMIDKPVPEFALPAIEGMDGPGLTSGDLKTGEVTLVNFFASWCLPCRVEHKYLIELAEKDGVRIAGVNYKNDPRDARAFLAEFRSPYWLIGADADGRVGIDWGVYGLPETFVVDGTGRIRYRHVGAVDAHAMNAIIRPLIKELSR